MNTIRRAAAKTNGWYLYLCVACSVISVLGLVSLGRGQEDMSKAVTQGAATLSGLVLALIVSRADYRRLLSLWPFYTAALWGTVLPTVFLHNVKMGPLTIGYDVGGTGNFSWYRLGSFSIQPAELAKIGFILTFAAHLSWAGERLNRLPVLLGLLAHLAFPVGLIHLQGDDGTALVFAAMGLTMLFAAGLSWKYILSALALIMGGIAAVLGLAGNRLLKSYQFARIMALFHPEDPVYAAYTYQQNKGILAAGSGRLWGRGLFADYHTYIPYAWNDFIFAYLGECLGFAGCLVILLLLFSLMALTLSAAHRAEDTAGRAICMGVFGALLFQTVINVGMNLQLLPVIGITLPFFSAGGTSTWMMYLAAGLVLAVHGQNSDDCFRK